jgi:hypothetical protein
MKRHEASWVSFPLHYVINRHRAFNPLVAVKGRRQPSGFWPRVPATTYNHYTPNPWGLNHLPRLQYLSKFWSWIALHRKTWNLLPESKMCIHSVDHVDPGFTHWILATGYSTI